VWSLSLCVIVIVIVIHIDERSSGTYFGRCATV